MTAALNGSRRIRELISERSAGWIGEAVITGIDSSITHMWSDAQEQARRVQGESVDDKVRSIARSFAQELGTVGAATGAAAALPAVGTAAALSVAAAEFAWFARRSSALVMTIAALHGHDESTVEERKMWILAVLAFGNGASEGATKLAGELGKGLGKKATERISTSTLRAMNKALGRTIVTKYGTKRGVIALGTALPFGIGAVFGGSANYASVRMLAKHAHKFFRDMPRSRIGDPQ